MIQQYQFYPYTYYLPVGFVNICFTFSKTPFNLGNKTKTFVFPIIYNSCIANKDIYKIATQNNLQ